MITDNYIKMCEEAVEIQDFWEQKEGSWVKWWDDMGNDYVVWLPTQEQLQEMIDWNIYQLTARFGEMVHYEAGNDKNFFTSMEQLWLAFVMKEKYNKVWDGENWVKEK